MTSRQMGRRRISLGRQHDGTLVDLAVRGRPVLIAGEPGTGKSWLAGLMCEQLILLGYCLCVLDPEGDYASLESLPGVVVLGGDDPPPRPRDLARALRHPDVSVVVDLSKVPHREKLHHLTTMMDVLLRHREETGLPHRIVVDEAHYMLAGMSRDSTKALALEGVTLVSYRVSLLRDALSLPDGAVVLVTKETDAAEAETLRHLCGRSGPGVPARLFAGLRTNEAALLPGSDEAGGYLRRFEVGARLTVHVRHRAKYLDMPVTDAEAFVFSAAGRPIGRSHSLKEFVAMVAMAPDSVIAGHLARHDFSRWLDDVFRDHPLALRLQTIEDTASSQALGDTRAMIDQTIRARYERIPSTVATAAASAHDVVTIDA